MCRKVNGCKEKKWKKAVRNTGMNLSSLLATIKNSHSYLNSDEILLNMQMYASMKNTQNQLFT